MRVHWIRIILNKFENRNSVDGAVDSTDTRQKVKLQIIIVRTNICIDRVSGK